MNVYPCICPNCNGNLRIPYNVKEYTCEFCGQRIIIDDEEDEIEELTYIDLKNNGRINNVVLKAIMICASVLSILTIILSLAYLSIPLGIISLILGIIVFKKKEGSGLIGIIIGGIILLLTIIGGAMAIGLIGDSPQLSANEQSLSHPEFFENITEDELVEVLKQIPGITEVAAVNSSNDINGGLSKEDGYTSEIFFKYNEVVAPEYSNQTAIEGGVHVGGAVEIFRNNDDAQSRVKYLDRLAFLGSGGHVCIRNVVIRTSEVLSEDKQQLLANTIIQAIDNK